MFGSFDISTSALSAQRVRLDTIASNIANVDTVKGKDGITPYRRLYTTFMAQRSNGGMGVAVDEIGEDQSDFNLKYEPGSPLADKNTGMVRYPNVNLSSEYVDALETTRAYEANVNAIETTKSMMAATLRVMG